MNLENLKESLKQRSKKIAAVFLLSIMTTVMFAYFFALGPEPILLLTIIGLIVVLLSWPVVFIVFSLSSLVSAYNFVTVSYLILSLIYWYMIHSAIVWIYNKVKGR